jgi:hypothetical protein
MTEKMVWPEYSDDECWSLSPHLQWDWRNWPTDDNKSDVREIAYNNGNTVDWDHVGNLKVISARDAALYMCGLNPEVHVENLPLGHAMQRKEELAADFFRKVEKIVQQVVSVPATIWTIRKIVDWADKAGHPVHRKFRALVTNGTVKRAGQAIPGTLPRSEVGKLAVTIAFNFQRDMGRPASPAEVMARLHDLAESGDEAGVLASSDRKRNEVVWYKANGETATFTANACQKVLAKWQGSLSE